MGLCSITQIWLENNLKVKWPLFELCTWVIDFFWDMVKLWRSVLWGFTYAPFFSTCWCAMNFNQSYNKVANSQVIWIIDYQLLSRSFIDVTSHVTRYFRSSTILFCQGFFIDVSFNTISGIWETFGSRVGRECNLHHSWTITVLQKMCPLKEPIIKHP